MTPFSLPVAISSPKASENSWMRARDGTINATRALWLLRKTSDTQRRNRKDFPADVGAEALTN